MKSEQIKQITNKAIEQLIAAINESRSESLSRRPERSSLTASPDHPHAAPLSGKRSAPLK